MTIGVRLYTFSLIPPTAVTRPRRVVSPVIAMYFGTVKPVNNETNAQTYATPADGPSFFTAPLGRCR